MLFIKAFLGLYCNSKLNCFAFKVGVAHERRSCNAFKWSSYRLPQETKQHTLINPCDYYCATSVLRSFKGYFYSWMFAYLLKHSKATNYSILELMAYILRKTATSCKSWTLRNFFTRTSDEWLPLKLLYRYYKMLSSTLSTTIDKLFHLSDVTVKSGKRIVNRLYLCISY